MISYWHSSIGREPLPADDLPAEAEVVVVGGGVHGACAALWLARAGRAPLLIDRVGPGAGATGNNGGLLVSGLAESYPAAVERFGRATARAIYGLTLEGYRLLDEIVREEAIGCDLRLTGNLSLAVGDEALAGMARAVALLREDGFPAELLDRAALEAQVDTPLGAEIVGGKFNPAAGALHSGRLVYGLLDAARRHGARLVWDTELRGVRAEAGGVLLDTSRGPLRAGAAILALNAWSGDVLPELAGKVTPIRGQALVTGALPPALKAGFGVSLTPTGEYGQQTPDGRVVFGGCRAVAPGHDVGVREPGGSPEVQAALDESLARIFPALAGAPVEQRWSGTMGFSPDYLPIVDRVPGVPGAWFSGGFSGHGMPYAAILGRLLADAAGGKVSEALAPFRLGR